MSRRKISTTVYIRPRQDEELKLLSQRTGTPVAEYIRRGIDLILEENRHHIPSQLHLDELLGAQERSPDASDRRAQRD